VTERAPRRRGRPPKEGTEELVLAAARELEAELGYDATSVEGIAKRAGVAKTSIYRRWPNKGALMYQAVLGSPPDFADIPDTGDVAADLLGVLVANAAGFRERRWRELVGSLMAEALRDADLAEALRTTFFEPRADAIARRVRLAVERRELAPTIDVELVPALLTGPLQYLWIVRGSELGADDLQRIVEAVVGPHRPRRRRGRT